MLRFLRSTAGGVAAVSGTPTGRQPGLQAPPSQPCGSREYAKAVPLRRDSNGQHLPRSWGEDGSSFGGGSRSYRESFACRGVGRICGQECTALGARFLGCCRSLWPYGADPVDELGTSTIDSSTARASFVGSRHALFRVPGSQRAKRGHASASPVLPSACTPLASGECTLRMPARTLACDQALLTA